jgi:protein TonB
MKYWLLAAALLPLASLAQQAPAPAKAPIVLRPGRMQVQAHGAANRPDKAPSFPGGADALGVFFQQHIRYPEAARVKGVTGNVVVLATVQVDGSLSDLKVAQGLTPECDAEALRAVALLPPWQPATRKGVPLPVQIQLPVPFANAAVIKVTK